MSRSRKSRRGCETTPLLAFPVDRPTHHGSIVRRPSINQPTNSRGTPLTPRTTIGVVAPRCPPPTPPTLGINENDVTAKSPAFNYQSYAPRRAGPRSRACTRVSVRACRRRRRPSTTRNRCASSELPRDANDGERKRRDRAFRGAFQRRARPLTISYTDHEIDRNRGLD